MQDEMCVYLEKTHSYGIVSESITYLLFFRKPIFGLNLFDCKQFILDLNFVCE